jgi:raffinose/stachyose/melibiose transport system permease protein
MSANIKKLAACNLKYGFIYIWLLIIIVPVIYLLLGSFKTTPEINRIVSLPSQINIRNYQVLFKNPVILKSFLNSTLVVGGSALIDVIIVSFSAYSLARRKEKYFTLIYFFIMSALMIPVSTNLISIYRLILDLGLKDTLTALILIYSASGIPMATLFYVGFIKAIPVDLDKSAMIDGCNYLQRFYLVIFPLLKPVTISFVILSIIGWWNDFLMPLLFISSKLKKTVTIEIYNFFTEHGGFDKGPIYALLILAALPLIILFFSAQKNIYSGITLGAIKG